MPSAVCQPDEPRSPMKVDVVAATAKSALFRGISATELAEVTAAAVLRKLLRGALLFQQGSEPAELYLLADGWIKLTHVTRNGDQIALRFMQRGEHVGGAPLFRGVPFPATATAASDATLVTWKAQFIRDRIARSPLIAQNALQLVGDRADDYLSRIQELASDPVDVRLARHLMELVSTSDRRTERGVSIEFPISRQDLAELCGTTLFTVSRILTRWRDLGLVDPGRQGIVVRDIARLAEVINDRPSLEGTR
ncbi:MAG: Crp/Fnr family transcriptional regulator [Casimicrobiaceae bacterium]